MTEITKAWPRIIRWYTRNVQGKEWRAANGAREEEIQQVESIVGLHFPADLRQSYRLHNGSRDQVLFPYGFHLLSLDGIVAQWKMWLSLVQAGTFASAKPVPTGPIKQIWWNPKWIPLTHNAGGDHQCSDMDPDKGGTVGQIIKFSHEVGPQRVLANSFTRWLTEFADELESGRYRFDEDEGWLVLAE
jgi:cell wall assembly regulator SMI1